MQNRVAYAKRARLTYTEVTRRDGLSSWRVIFFVAVGMLSGTWTANYVVEMFGKVDFSYEIINSFSPGVFFRLPLML